MHIYDYDTDDEYTSRPAQVAWNANYNRGDLKMIRPPAREENSGDYFGLEIQKVWTIGTVLVLIAAIAAVVFLLPNDGMSDDGRPFDDTVTPAQASELLTDIEILRVAQSPAEWAASCQAWFVDRDGQMSKPEFTSILVQYGFTESQAPAVADIITDECKEGK